jgi:hypothetical protein
VSHFFKSVSLWDGFVCIDVESAKFSFGGKGHEGPDELGEVEERTVVFRVGGVGEHKEMSAGMAARFEF